jgi:hypothetical protein
MRVHFVVTLNSIKEVSHGPPPGPEYRSIHVQATTLKLPSGACDFGRQGVHEEDIAPAYVFTAQAVQDEAPAAAKFPPSQIEQGVPPSTQYTTVKRSFAILPTAHKKHAEDPAAENLPVEQLTQAALPEVFLYVPELQAVQASPRLLAFGKGSQNAAKQGHDDGEQENDQEVERDETDTYNEVIFGRRRPDSVDPRPKSRKRSRRRGRSGWRVED